MSENLDLVRSIYAAWERGDFSHVEWAHPEIEYVFVDGPELGSFTGVAGMAKAWGGVLRNWSDTRVSAVRYVPLDDGRILVFSGNSARWRRSVLEFPGQSAVTLFEIAQGQVSRLAIYWDRDRALADVGLEE